jgi:hypothetical protein
MKKIFLMIFLSLILVSCTETFQTFDQYKNHYGSSYKYSKVCSKSAKAFNSQYCSFAGASTQNEANQNGLSSCGNVYSDCVVVMEGNNTVYAKGQTDKVQMATLIDDSKNTCRSLGFKDGTDKFTDCSLKLYSQKLDLAEKQKQQVVVQNQGSSTVRVIDVTRERETTMRRSMGLINGTCTLATYYSC